jgi:hypothetical protein
MPYVSVQPLQQHTTFTSQVWENYCAQQLYLKEFLHDKTLLVIGFFFIHVMFTKLLSYEDGINGLDS